MSTIPLTKLGAQLLKEELQRLKHVERPAVINAISEARAQGDLSENAEYSEARDEQAKIDKIRAGTLSRIDIISKDAVSTQDQKNALIQGYQRLERQQIFEALTMEHKAEIHKRAAALRAAAPAGRRPKPGVAPHPLPSN